MGRYEIETFLEQNKGIKFDSRTIAILLDISLHVVHNNLKQMRKYGDVNYKEKRFEGNRVKNVYWLNEED